MGGAFTGYSLYAFLNTTKTYMVFRFWTPPRYLYRGFLLLLYPAFYKKLTVKGLPWNTMTVAAASILPDVIFFFISKNYRSVFYKYFIFNVFYA